MGIWMALARAGLMRLKKQVDPRNWRPHLLVLTGAPMKRWHLVDLARSFSHNRSIMTISTVLPSDSVTPERRQTIEANIRDYMEKRGVQGLVRAILAPDPFVGSSLMVESYGLGTLMPNTILLGDSKEEEHRNRYCNMVRRFYDAQRNVLIVRDDEKLGFGAKRRIDIWWGGLQGNGALMLILAYLLQTSMGWQGARVRLNMVVPDEAGARDARKNLRAMADRTRTGAEPNVLVKGDRDFWEILHDASSGADLVFMGIAAPKDTDFTEYYQGLRERTTGLPSTVYVLAAEEIAFREVLLRYGDEVE